MPRPALSRGAHATAWLSVVLQGPILSRVDTSKEDREEALEKKKLRNERKAKQVKRMIRAKDRVSANRIAALSRQPS